MAENEFVVIDRPRKRNDPTPSEKAIAETLKKTEERLQAAETEIQTLSSQLRASEADRQEEFNKMKNINSGLLRRLEELEITTTKNNNRAAVIKERIEAIVPSVRWIELLRSTSLETNICLPRSRALSTSKWKRSQKSKKPTPT